MGEIYYQLLSGAMGTLAFAYENDITSCYFIIYQLIPEQDEKKFSSTIKKHKAAINSFIQQINSSYDINTQNVIKLGDYTLNLDESKGERKIELNIAYVEHTFIQEKKQN